MPNTKHGTATTTITTIPVTVNAPFITSDSSGASTATSDGCLPQELAKHARDLAFDVDGHSHLDKLRLCHGNAPDYSADRRAI